MRQGGLAEEERRRQVHRQLAVPVLGADVAEALLGDHAGVVDQIIQPPVLIENLGDQPLAGSRLPDIGLMQGHGGPAARSLVVHRMRSDVVAGVRRGHRDAGAASAAR